MYGSAIPRVMSKHFGPQPPLEISHYDCAGVKCTQKKARRPLDGGLERINKRPARPASKKLSAEWFLGFGRSPDAASGARCGDTAFNRRYRGAWAPKFRPTVPQPRHGRAPGTPSLREVRAEGWSELSPRCVGALPPLHCVAPISRRPVCFLQQKFLIIHGSNK